MNCAKMMLAILLSIALLSLLGCGSGSSGALSNSPFTNSGTIFGNINTKTGTIGITMTLDRPSVDVDGQVLATATLVNNEVGVGGVPVTFSIVAPAAGPASVDPDLVTVTTDSNGKAVSRITTGQVPSTTNVIVKATGKMSGNTFVAYATFQIVRGTGVIMFTQFAGENPGDQITSLQAMSFRVDPATVPGVMFLQAISFKLTDANGNPRVGVPVSLTIYNTTGTPITPNTPAPVVTDSAGMGIFNQTITMSTPPNGSFSSASVIYQASTNDLIPVTAYISGSYSLTGVTGAAPP